MRHRISQLHFVGIGGTGMSGLAEVMLNLGYRVSGSDLADSAVLAHLRERGAQVHVGHSAEAVGNADAVVISSAIGQANPEVDEARRRNVPVVPRATMLGELLRLRQGIAVAGSHGKTTITSMIAAVLHEAKLDPTYVVGGRVRQFDSSAGLGAGEFIVVETDESDGSFLHLHPIIAVVSNIDEDHMATYDHDLRKLKRAFADFLENLPFYGLAVMCFDDPHARDVAAMTSRRVISYGIEHPGCDFTASAIESSPTRTSYMLAGPEGEQRAEVRALGSHNVLNSLAAHAVAYEINVPAETAATALSKFAGVGRRLERHGEVRLGDAAVELIDDYGHHPTEIAVTLKTVAQAHPERRIVLVFQPHRYSRTRDTFDALADTLAQADVLLLTEIYAAGEEAIPAVSGESLAHAVRLRGNSEVLFVPSLDDLPKRLGKLVADGDLVLCMGAGSISQLARKLSAGT